MCSKTSAGRLAVRARPGHIHAYISSIPSRPCLPLMSSLHCNSARAVGDEKLTSFLRERVFGLNTSLNAYVLLIKRLTFVRGQICQADE